MDAFILVTVMCSLVLVVAAEEQTCLSFFQMSGSTIIRTVDSRNRGATYINESNVATKEECANLCCDTNECTVAVFEEKKPGGCYLFNCGLTDDFQCKFTSHEHYVSYVMKVNRHQFDLQTWKKHAKHEQELSNLRPSAPTQFNVPSPPPSISSSTTAVAPTTSTSTSTSSTPAVPKTTENKCTQFQFKCQGSGDCIAVYNACDGIPQCADGSDEKAGLGCPNTSTSSSELLQNKETESGSPISSIHALQAMNNLAPPSIQRDEYNQKQVGRLSQAVDPQEIFVHRDGGLIREEGALHYPNRAHGVNKLGYVDQNRQPYIQYPGYPPLPPQPNREGFAYNSSPSREETPSLFRGSLPRETESSFAPAMDRGNPTPFREDPGRYHDSRAERIPYTEQKSRYRMTNERPDPYPGPSGREGVPIYREGAPVYSETLQKDAVSYGAPAGRKSSSGYGGGYGMEEYEYKHPHYVPEQWRPPEQPNMHRNTEEWKSSEVANQRGPSGPLSMDPGQVLVRDGPKKGFMPHVPHVEEEQEVAEGDPRKYHNEEHKDLVAEDTPVEVLSKAVFTTGIPENTEGATGATTTKTNKVLATEPPANKTEDTGATSNKVASEAEKLQTEDLIDGHTKRYSGAVMIVVLGCLVTMSLLLVITCRLRAVRARLRRGGLSPYAHDADYLVNGMYL